MKEQWEKWDELLAARSLRERVIVLVTVCVVVIFAWAQFVFTPVTKHIQGQFGEIARMNSDMEAASAELSILESRLKVDPNAVLREEQANLKAQLEEQRADMQQRLKEMVAPSQMADVLRQVLSEFQGLKLVVVKNNPAQPFSVNEASEPGRDTGAENDDTAGVPVFQHSLELVLEGGFFDSLIYLKRLERLEEQFQWEMLDMTVVDFPRMRISLVVQTLSLEEEWIGV